MSEKKPFNPSDHCGYANVTYDPVKERVDKDAGAQEQMRITERICSKCQDGNLEKLRWCPDCEKYFCNDCCVTEYFDGFVTGFKISCPSGHKLYVRAAKCG